MLVLIASFICGWVYITRRLHHHSVAIYRPSPTLNCVPLRWHGLIILTAHVTLIDIVPSAERSALDLVRPPINLRRGPPKVEADFDIPTRPNTDGRWRVTRHRPADCVWSLCKTCQSTVDHWLLHGGTSLHHSHSYDAVVPQVIGRQTGFTERFQRRPHKGAQYVNLAARLAKSLLVTTQYGDLQLRQHAKSSWPNWSGNTSGHTHTHSHTHLWSSACIYLTHKTAPVPRHLWSSSSWLVGCHHPSTVYTYTMQVGRLAIRGMTRPFPRRWWGSGIF